MKRFLILILALLTVLSFAACSSGGGDDAGKTGATAENKGGETTAANVPSENGGKTGDNGGQAGDIDLESLMSGEDAAKTIWSQQDAATKQKLIEAARASGYEVTFGADGSMTVKGEDLTAIQYADGTWKIDNEGSQSQYGGTWPDNDFSKQVPKPVFKIKAAGVDGSEFSVIFEEVSLEQARDYAEKLKNGGFVNAPETIDQTQSGFQYFLYAAENSAGYKASISYYNGTCALTVSNYGENE